MASLRRAAAQDVPDLFAIARAAFSPYLGRIGREPAPMTADYETLVREAEVWVAEEDGTAVGLLVLISGDHHLELEVVAVLPATPGRGIGGSLLAHAEGRAVALGFDEIRLCTNEQMTENQALYTSRGYVETHRGEQAGFRRVFYAKRLAHDPVMGT